MIGGKPYRQLGDVRPGGIICVADHASNHVPSEVELGIEPALMDEHIALDIGVEGVAERMARRHGIPAQLATVSRLVCDLHRNEDEAAVVPGTSDGYLIPGNIGADVERRLAAYHRPYHEAFAAFVRAARPRLILSLHSFTPQLATCDKPRPWEVALLYNQDDRGARHAIRILRDHGLTVGDNEPYSGKQLNATMNRHAETAGIPYCTFEVRQEQITTEAGQARWASLLADVAQRVVHLLD